MVKKLLFGYFVSGLVLIGFLLFKVLIINTLGYGLFALFVILTVAITGFFFLIELTGRESALNIPFWCSAYPFSFLSRP